jgi:NADP-dependent aldehyde dehydrogenase
MLTPRIASVYASGVDRLRAKARAGRGGARPGRRSRTAGPRCSARTAPRAGLARPDGRGLRARRRCWCAYRDRAELLRLVEALEGQLTATVHASASELPEYADAVRALEAKSGRLVFDQFPTGVEVGHAMVHGGPSPATSDGRSTSVGTRAIERFTRPGRVPERARRTRCREALQDANPLGIARMVDGVVTTKGL